jgi:hypothetical protein
MIELSAQLEGISSRVDKSWKLTFGTQELSPIEIGSLGQIQNAVCFLAINPETFTSEELRRIEDTKVEMADEGKSPSQRLRGVLFVAWKNDPEGYEVFNDYYIHKMEKVINHFKSKLP